MLIMIVCFFTFKRLFLNFADIKPNVKKFCSLLILYSTISTKNAACISNKKIHYNCSTVTLVRFFDDFMAKRCWCVI